MLELRKYQKLTKRQTNDACLAAQELRLNGMTTENFTSFPEGLEIAAKHMPYFEPKDQYAAMARVRKRGLLKFNELDSVKFRKRPKVSNEIILKLDALRPCSKGARDSWFTSDLFKMQCDNLGVNYLEVIPAMVSFYKLEENWCREDLGVYCVRLPALPNVYKIGKASNLQARVKQYQTVHPHYRCEVFRPDIKEHHIHDLLAKYRILGIDAHSSGHETFDLNEEANDILESHYGFRLPLE